MSRVTSQKASLFLQGFNSHQSSDVPREVLLTVRNIYALVYVKARATEVFLDSQTIVHTELVYSTWKSNDGGAENLHLKYKAIGTWKGNQHLEIVTLFHLFHKY